MRRPAQGPARGRQRPRLVPVVPPRQRQQLPAAAPAGPAAQPGPHQPEDTRPGAAMGGGLALPPATSSPPDAIAPDACSLKIGDLVVSVGGQTAPEESIKVKKKKSSHLPSLPIYGVRTLAQHVVDTHPPGIPGTMACLGLDGGGMAS